MPKDDAAHRLQKELAMAMERQAEADFALKLSEYNDDYDDQVGGRRKLSRKRQKRVLSICDLFVIYY